MFIVGLAFQTCFQAGRRTIFFSFNREIRKIKIQYRLPSERSEELDECGYCFDLVNSESVVIVVIVNIFFRVPNSTPEIEWRFDVIEILRKHDHIIPAMIFSQRWDQFQKIRRRANLSKPTSRVSPKSHGPQLELHTQQMIIGLNKLALYQCRRYWLEWNQPLLLR